MKTSSTSGSAHAGPSSSPASLDAYGNKPTSASGREDAIRNSDVQIGGRDQARHGHRWKQRKAIMGSLSMRSTDRAPGEDQAQTDTLDRRSYNLACCNTYPKIWLTHSGLPRVIWGQCRDRLCPRCAFYRSKRLERDIRERVQGCDSLRFITLTLAADAKPLANRLDRLYQAFRDLRRRLDWKDRVRGGVATLEVTRNWTTGNWNVHLHIIVDGCFFDQAMLSKIWLDVTGDSNIVYIKAVFDREKTGKYIAKYVAKMASVVGWAEAAVREFALALSGRRLVITFGALHGSDVDLAQAPEREGVTESIADCNRIVLLAHTGNIDAQRAIQIARVLGPTFAGAFGVYAKPGWDAEPPPPAAVYESFVAALAASHHPHRPDPHCMTAG